MRRLLPALALLLTSTPTARGVGPCRLGEHGGTLGTHGVLTPYQCGAAGDLVTDDSAALDLYFDTVEDEGLIADWRGTWGVASPVSIEGTHQLHYPGTLVARGPMSYVLDVTVRDSVFLAPIRVVGTGSTVYDQRTVVEGVLLNGTQRTQFAGFDVRNVTRNCVRVLGNATGSHLGHVSFTDCGSSGVLAHPSTVTLSWSGREDTGGQGSPDQLSHLLPEGGLPDLAVGDVVLIQGNAHVVMDLSGGLLSVHPWVRPLSLEEGEATSLHGAGLAIRTPSSAWMTVGSVTGFRAGVALEAGGLYGPHVGMLGMQAGGVLLRIGTLPNGTNMGLTVDGLYGETRLRDILKVTRSNARAVVSGWETPLDQALLEGVSPTLATGEPHPSWSGLESVSLLGPQP